MDFCSAGLFFWTQKKQGMNLAVHPLIFCFELFEKRLFTQSECFYNCTITLDVFFLEIVEHAASFADKLNQCSVSAIIFMIDLHVLGQTADTV